MATRPEQFSFAPGKLLDEITVERMEALRRAAVANKPSPTGHINAKVRSTPDGWTIEANAPARGGGSVAGFSRRYIPAELDDPSIPVLASEVKTAIETAYDDANAIPQIGDLIYFTEFHFEVAPLLNIENEPIGENDIFRVDFTVVDSGESYNFLAIQIGPSRLL